MSYMRSCLPTTQSGEGYIYQPSYISIAHDTTLEHNVKCESYHDFIRSVSRNNEIMRKVDDNLPPDEQHTKTK